MKVQGQVTCLTKLKRLSYRQTAFGRSFCFVQTVKQFALKAIAPLAA
jgi:hypothetical protein